MKASLIAVASGAALVLAAGPLQKKEYVFETVTDVTTTTVWADPVEPKTLLMDHRPHEQHQTVKVSEIPTPAPVVVQETHEAPPPPAKTTETPQPAPQPTTSAPPPPAQSPAQPQSSSQPANADASAPSGLADASVHHHNIHRANNSAPDMSWSQKHADYAATVAASCRFAHDLTPGGGGYGQNIAMMASSDLNSNTFDASKAIAQTITEMWYNGEIGLYPSSGYGQANPDMSNFEAWGHYSQVAWVGSTQVGCAVQLCGSGSMNPTMSAWYAVCNYYPPGNVNGAYGKNVLRPLNKATVNV